MSTSFKTVLLVALAAGAVIRAQQPSQVYAEISDRIYFHVRQGETGAQADARSHVFKFPPAEEMDRLTSELHALGQSAVERVLATPDSPSAKAVEGALDQLQGPLTLSQSYPHISNVPFADMRTVHGSPVLLDAFAVMRGGFAIPEILPSLQFYSRANGAWSLAAEAGSDFSGRAFSIAPISSPSPDNEAWYLVWGAAIGDNGARLKIELLGFDGLSVRTIWSRDGLPGGSASVRSGRVRLEYDDYGITMPEHPKGNPFVVPKHVVEILRPTSNGLERDYSEPPQ